VQESFVFVDSNVKDYSMLVGGVRSGVEVVILSSDQDGLMQITDTLTCHDELDRIHIVSHGNQAELLLGNIALNPESLPYYYLALQSWRNALSKGAEIFLYGCNVAQGMIGQQFIGQLGAIVQANIAASVDLTGAAALGGNWSLSFHYGKISGHPVFAQSTLDAYNSTLAIETISFSEDELTKEPLSSYTKKTNDYGNIIIKGTDTDIEKDFSSLEELINPAGLYNASYQFGSGFSTGIGLNDGTSKISTGTWFVFATEKGNEFDLASLQMTEGFKFFDLMLAIGVRDGVIVAKEEFKLAQGETKQTIKMPSEFDNVDEVAIRQITSGYYDNGLPGQDGVLYEAFNFQPSPATITSATYDASINTLIVTGTHMIATDGAANDIEVTKLTIIGQGGVAYTLTTSNVELTSSSGFAVMLNAADQMVIEGLLNRNGAIAVDSTTFQIVAEADWNPAQSGNAAATSNTIAVSNVQTPAISSATYNASTGVLTVTGSNLVKASGTSNDVDVSKFTFTGEGGVTYTLTNSSDVEITSGTVFSVTLSSTDKAAVNQIINKNGTSSTSATTYNLAVADDWNTVIGNANISDATGNGITVSNVAAPAITSATYDANTGALVVMGAGFLSLSGAANDIDVSKFTFTGEGGMTYTLTDSADVEIISGTAFTIILSSTDKTAVNLLLNKAGTASTDATIYNLAAAEDWASGADVATIVTDTVANSITVSVPPTSSGGQNTDSIVSFTVDGSTITQKTQSNGTIITTVPTILATRIEDPNSLFSQYADIPVNKHLIISLPEDTGLKVLGKRQSLNREEGSDQLIEQINALIDVDSVAQEIVNHVQNFVATLPDEDLINVQVITPSRDTDLIPELPIMVTGFPAIDSDKQALVIDARNLPSNAVLRLDHIPFATIIGAVRVTGGDGENCVVGDEHHQYIVLGAADDTLSGGGGNDTIGSLGGNDGTSGDAGSDIVFGGSGNDLLSGGTGNDQLNGGLGFDSSIQGGQLSDYQVTIQGNAITLTQDNGEVDTLTDVELIHFASGLNLAIAYSEVEAIAHHLAKNWLGRDLTAVEGSAVQNWIGATTDDILTVFRSLPEAVAFQGKPNDELLANLETNSYIIQLDPLGDWMYGDENNQGYLPLGLAMNADGGTGFDVLHMLGSRDDVHLEFVDNRLELTRLNDGAMLSLKNAETIVFDSGETVAIAHNQTEEILARLVHSFFNRDATVEEWQLGQKALDDQASHESILAWFKQHAPMDGLSDATYIDVIYQNTLGRVPNNSELTRHLSQLEDHQISREWFAVEIAESSEAAAQLIGSVMLQEGWV